VARSSIEQEDLTTPPATFAEPLIDCEEDRTLRAVLVELREGGRI